MKSEVRKKPMGECGKRIEVKMNEEHRNEMKTDHSGEHGEHGEHEEDGEPRSKKDKRKTELNKK